MLKIYKNVYHDFPYVVEQCLGIVRNLNAFIQGACPTGQISLQTDTPEITNWQSGIGKSDQQTHEWEHTFCHIQPELKGTAIEDYFNWLGVDVFRSRIMLSREKSSYSIHNDYSPRLHLPLITNEQCKFVFTEPAELLHMPADGCTYWVDTRRKHTFINGSNMIRLHLVMVVKE